MTIDELRKKADYIRDEVIRVGCDNNLGHIASSLSTVDILVALYYSVMKPEDIFILSKAHGCYALYAILADKGIMPRDQWENFGMDKSKLTGCASYMPEYGIMAGCGSLGHGLPIAAGIAFGNKLQNKKGHVYVLVGDGELQEGSNWEAIHFIIKNGIRNLTTIIDCNGLQAMERLKYQHVSIAKRFEGFGFIDDDKGFCDGHDIEDLITSFVDNELLICNTIKGYGLACMENKPEWHYRVPTAIDLLKGKTYGE